MIQPATFLQLLAAIWIKARAIFLLIQILFL